MPPHAFLSSNATDGASPTTPRRHSAALDYLRGFLTVVVLAHHAALAYTYLAHFDREHYVSSTAPIVDPQRWAGFDLFTLFNDLFFMSLMFFVSGLFVWPSLRRKGGRQFLRDRALRLGLPFAIAVTILMPLAYYPSVLVAGGAPDSVLLWGHGPRDAWPAGPAWFVWLLLAFDALAALLHYLAPRLGDRLGRRSAASAKRPGRFLALLLLASATGYLPLLLVFGPHAWIIMGPFAFQASRLLHYAVYFFAGVAVGAHGVERGLLAPDGMLARRWIRWVAAAAATYVLVVALRLALQRRSAALGPLATELLHGFSFLIGCGVIGFAFLALFLRFARRRSRPLDSLSENAYGMYLVHYAFVVWLQYALLNVGFPALAKGIIAFLGTLGLSWSLTGTVRRIPAVARVI
jgi:hypothetical protein